ncbi:MAG: conjugal transfer protein TraF [Gammaproteobacteria bacterium]|nr:conjugal transfer protein TraF [Gammaproteobacteria bacterium]
MKLKTLAVATAVALTSTTATAAPWSSIDARTAAMGGASVATATLDSAAYYNPALLAAQDADADFSLSMSAGVSYADSQNLTGAIDDFSTSLQSFQNLDYANYSQDAAGLAEFQNDVNTAYSNLNTSLNNLGGKSYTLATPIGANLGFTLGEWAASLSTQSYIDAAVGVGAADGTPSLTPETVDASLYADPSSLTTDARVEFNGVSATEIGVSLARTLNLAGLDFAVGLTPKLVSIASATGTQELAGSGIPALTVSNASSDFNLDAGAVWKVSKSFRLGLSMRNLMAKSYALGGGGTYEVAPQMRAGIGYTSKFMTVGADMDLTENDVFGEKSRIMAAGVEFDAWKIMQLRLGYTNDLATTLTQYSVGMGFLNNALNFAAVIDPNATGTGFSGYLGFAVNF